MGELADLQAAADVLVNELHGAFVPAGGLSYCTFPRGTEEASAALQVTGVLPHRPPGRPPTCRPTYVAAWRYRATYFSLEAPRLTLADLAITPRCRRLNFGSTNA